MLQDELEKYIRTTKVVIKELCINTHSVRYIVENIVEFAGVNNIRQAVAAYQNKADYLRVYEGFCLLLKESVDSYGSWIEVLQELEGKDQVLLLTIHKSKSLEYDMVFVLGFDDRSWRSLKEASENS